MNAIDPLMTYRTGARTALSAPVPLVRTDVAAAIDGGLVLVSFKRVFRNVEKQSIEATITFPVPIDAVMVGLEARIGDRVLTGTAKRRAEARERYEAAMDSGRSAVLHEEALKGIHVLTVGHVPPGATIEVESRWVQPLSFTGPEPRFRIPVTSGDIYGRSPLQPVDDLVTGDVVHKGTLSVTASSGRPSVDGVVLVDGRREIELDRAIDVVVSEWSSSPVKGNLDGRTVEIGVDRAVVETASTDFVVLADRSGSMDQAAMVDGVATTKFSAMLAALRKVAEGLSDDDGFALWQFSSGFAELGAGKGRASALTALDRLQQPSGGTDIGEAVAGVVARNPSGNILLVTDGRSHALDVEELARGEHRVTVVLIGREALEARVGHLAALTGGQIFVAAADEVAPALRAAMDSMRAPFRRAVAAATLPQSISETRGGARIVASFSDGGSGTDAIGAYAAGLSLPLLPAEAGAALAETAGIVSHLTSLVLVDDVGEVQEGLPAMRKVPLMKAAGSRGIMRSMASMEGSATLSFAAAAPASMRLEENSWAGSGYMGGLETMDAMPSAMPRSPKPMPTRIDWSQDAPGLLEGDMSGMGINAMSTIGMLKTDAEVVAFAKRKRMSLDLAALALIASVSADRYAVRFLRKLLPDDGDRRAVHAMAIRLGVTTA